MTHRAVTVFLLGVSFCKAQWAPLLTDNVGILNVPGESDPDPFWWPDSYSVGNHCYCLTSFDHEIGTVRIDTPLGVFSIFDVCKLLGPGPGLEGRPLYNDIQCGNGPDNSYGDEINCPGRVEHGQEGCKYIGPKFNFEGLLGQLQEPPPDSNSGDEIDCLGRDKFGKNGCKYIGSKIDFEAQLGQLSPQTPLSEGQLGQLSLLAPPAPSSIASSAQVLSPIPQPQIGQPTIPQPQLGQPAMAVPAQEPSPMSRPQQPTPMTAPLHASSPMSQPQHPSAQPPSSVSRSRSRPAAHGGDIKPAPMWENTSSHPHAHQNAMGGLLGNGVFIVASGNYWNMIGRTASVHVLNTKSGNVWQESWQTRADVPVAFGIINAGTALSENTMYICGGETIRGATSRCFSYDSPSDTWSELPSLPEPRVGGALFYVPERVALVFAGGEGGHQDTWVLYLEDASEAWYRKADVPTSSGRMIAASVTISDGSHRVLALRRDNLFEWDIWNESWGFRATSGFGDASNIMSTNCGALVIAGRDVVFYDYAQDTWQKMWDMPLWLSSPICGVREGYLYCSGGTADNTSSSIRWRFTS